MNRSVPLLVAIAAISVAFAGWSAPSAMPVSITTASDYPSTAVQATTAGDPVNDATIQPPLPVPAPVAAHAAPVPSTAATVAPKTPAQTTPTAATSGRAAYVNAMYLSVVPASERAALAGRYVLGYNLPGLSCGDGCTGLFDGQVRSSFDAAFFTEPTIYQRNTVAHEAAHAYGFLYFADYAAPSWASVGGWQSQFSGLDRGFVRTYDAEAWAACVAWRQTGFNDLSQQVRGLCTSTAAELAIAHIA